MLDWIDRVDAASQTGAPKPPFETESGDPIFPDEDSMWWLTDVQRRQPEEEAPNGDEDGPPSDVDVEEDMQREASDSDPVSAGEGDMNAAAPVRKGQTPVIGWRM